MVEMNRWVDEQLASGRIRPSKSPYASPFFFKHEKDKLQPIIDYSKLNKYLIKDKYPLPLIRDTVDVLKGATIYSKIDAKGGFPYMQVWPEHQHRCAFLTPHGLFEPAVPWKWKKEVEAAFQDLCLALILAPVLALSQDKGRWKVEMDASNLATGGVRSQLQMDGTWRVIDYISKALTAAEKNYDLYEKEFLAVIWALWEWRAYLIGVDEMIKIWTDHVNLQYFRKPQKLKLRQVRWVGELQCFDFEIKYRTGKSNTKADALS